jgi:hypothetical protein
MTGTQTLFRSFFKTKGLAVPRLAAMVRAQMNLGIKVPSDSAGARFVGFVF